MFSFLDPRIINESFVTYYNSSTKAEEEVYETAQTVLKQTELARKKKIEEKKKEIRKYILEAAEKGEYFIDIIDSLGVAEWFTTLGFKVIFISKCVKRISWNPKDIKEEKHSV